MTTAPRRRPLCRANSRHVNGFNTVMDDADAGGNRPLRCGAERAIAGRGQSRERQALLRTGMMHEALGRPPHYWWRFICSGTGHLRSTPDEGACSNISTHVPLTTGRHYPSNWRRMRLRH